MMVTTATVTATPSSSRLPYLDERCSVLGCDKPFVGANLGGWLVLEGWMDWYLLKRRHAKIPDEWTLIQRHGGPLDPRAIHLMRKHWNKFLKETYIDKMRDFGVTHFRVPLGWWLVDYDAADGFVDGGEYFLRRLMRWLKTRGMRALLVMHALPGAQVARQSFTGKISAEANFFKDRGMFERGKLVMRKLAELIASYDSSEDTAGVVMGLEVMNEPDWNFWNTSPGQREFYEYVIPDLRLLLPARRYAIYINPQEWPRKEVSSKWLAEMRKRDPDNYSNVVYDTHQYHSFGDDNNPATKHGWTPDVDSCKNCCRDPLLFQPLIDAGLPVAVGEYALNTGLPQNWGEQRCHKHLTSHCKQQRAEFQQEYFTNQLSLWSSIPGMVGSFFWNFRVIRRRWYLEFSLLELMSPSGPLQPVKHLELSSLCPAKNLGKCPKFNVTTVSPHDSCTWLTEAIGI